MDDDHNNLHWIPYVKVQYMTVFCGVNATRLFSQRFLIFPKDPRFKIMTVCSLF